MEQNEYSELPVNLRKQIFELYTGARNPNYSPDFNSGFIHALETLFGYNNCSINPDNDVIEPDLVLNCKGTVYSDPDKNQKIPIFLPDNGNSDPLSMQKALFDYIKENEKLNCKINIKLYKNV